MNGYDSLAGLPRSGRRRAWRAHAAPCETGGTGTRMAYFDTCPACGSDDVSGNARRGDATWHGCGYVSAADAPAPSVMPAEAADAFDALPFPVA